jgi:hypothetical protein
MPLVNYDVETWCLSSHLVIGDGYLLECDVSLHDNLRVVTLASVVAALFVLAIRCLIHQTKRLKVTRT